MVAMGVRRNFSGGDFSRGKIFPEEGQNDVFARPLPPPDAHCGSHITNSCCKKLLSLDQENSILVLQPVAATVSVSDARFTMVFKLFEEWLVLL